MFDVQGFFVNNTEVKWYVLQVYVGFERAVKKNLELKIQNLGIQDRIQEIYIPTKKVQRLKKSKGSGDVHIVGIRGKNNTPLDDDKWRNSDTSANVQERQEKVFSGYIYIKCLLDQEVGYMIQNTPYISRIAGTGDLAVALEDGYVEKMKVRLAQESDNMISSTAVNYKIGELVKVVDGAFKDMQGKVCGIDIATSRVNVLLTIFERESNVELSTLEIQKVF